MPQEKAAEIIDLNVSRAVAPGQSRFEKAGEFLASARRAAGFGLEAVSAETKVKIEHLEAIEQTRPDLLPALPYAVGFVKVYARFLDLDAAAMAAQFKDDIGAAVPPPVEFTTASAKPQAMPEIGDGPRTASVFGIVAVLIFAGWAAFGILAKEDAAADAVITEENSSVETSPVTTPRSGQLDENASQLAEQDSEPRAGVVADSDIPVAATIANLQPDAGLLTADANAVSEADAVYVQDLPTAALSQDIALATPTEQITAQPAPVAAKPVIIASQLSRSVAPGYPDRCGIDAAALESVTVIFDVTVAGRIANGRVVSSTNTCFEKSALRTIKRWRFNPKTVDGVAKNDAGKSATLHFRR